MTAFSETEHEIIILNAVWGMINDMVNYEMFVKNERINDVTLQFNTATDQRLFNILLVDFLSLPQRRGNDPLPFHLPAPPRAARPTDLTYLFYLRQVCQNPKLCNCVEPLLSSVTTFSDWLETESLVENVWLPSVNINLNIKMKRIEFLKICGDIAKHNFTRLEANVKKICRVIGKNGGTVDEKLGYLALPEFYEWYHTGNLNYHASTIAEFLNNIRWAIYEYLRPEFERSYEQVDPAPKYRFRCPDEVTSPIAQAMHWDLMNMTRSPPYFPKFTVTEWLKKRY